jgi:hypothetical protein
MTNEALSKLASIPIGEGREAAIWRDQDGTVRWSTGGAVAGAQGSDPFLAWAPNGTLACCHVPVGACEVEIRAPVDPLELVVAGGAYVALLPARLDTRNVFAVFRDDNGAIVPVRPVDAEVLARHLISDTDTVCPACGECDWEAIQIRASPDRDFTREEIVVCRVCGRQEGGRRSAGRRRDRPERATRPHAHPPGLSDDPKPAEVVAATAFDVYALDTAIGGRGQPGGWSWGDQAINEVSIEHTIAAGGLRTTVEVTSSANDEKRDLRATAVAMLESELLTAALLQLNRSSSDGAFALAGNAAAREAAGAAQQADVREIELPVASTNLRFTIASTNEPRWVAAAHTAGTQILIKGTTAQPDDMRLILLSDPETYFAAPRA